MNKRGTGAAIFLGVLILVVVVLGLLVVFGASDLNAVEKIGEYQNPLLDSYTVAEGSRLYLEKSVKYSAIKAIDVLGYCGVEDIEENKQEFIEKVQLYFVGKFVDNIPIENMGLFISVPPKSDNMCEIKSDILYCYTKNIHVSNCVDELCKVLKFNFTTQLNPAVSYDLNKGCADYNALIGV